MSRILCIDYGKKRIGLAISDPGRVFSFPLKMISNKPGQVIPKLKEVIQDREVGLVIIGYPNRTDGKPSKMGEQVESFKQELEKEFPDLEIDFWDEMYSSQIAEDVLISLDASRKRRKQVIDSVAASIILKNYLESLK